MISVALCITDLNVGGAERCLVELATRLDKNRFVPVVYCLSAAPRPGEATLIPALQSAGLEFACLGAQRAVDFYAVAARLARMLSERKTQILQSFLFHANLVGRIAAWRGGVPHVVCGIRVAQRRSAWHRWLDRMTHGMVDRYVCVSQSVARFSASTARLPADKLVVIPNGIDVSRFSNVQPADLTNFGLSGRRLVTFIGRFEVQKGLPQLLATASDWLPRLPDCDLLLVGKGPLEMAMRRQCRIARIAERVHFAGWQAEIPAILAAEQPARADLSLGRNAQRCSGSDGVRTAGRRHPGGGRLRAARFGVSGTVRTLREVGESLQPDRASDERPWAGRSAWP